MKFRHSLALCALASLGSVAAPRSARAQAMLRPASVSTNMGAFIGAGNINTIINGSGLSTNYTSGVTDFSTYTGTHNSTLGANFWQSSSNTIPGNIDFNLGGTYTIQNFALWCSTSTFRVKDFTLLASLDSSFSTTTDLGSFTYAFSGSNTAVNMSSFSFAPTTAAFVRMRITSNSGGTATAQIGEAAFVAVPEPGSLALLALGGVGLLVRRRRN